MTINKKHIWGILFCLYLIAVAYLCFAKPDELPSVKPDFFGIPIDKMAHFMMFFPFPMVAYKAFRPKGENKGTRLLVLLIVYVVGMALAIGTEHIQGQLGYRSEDVQDFYADLIGISCSAAVTAVYILLKRH